MNTDEIQQLAGELLSDLPKAKLFELVGLLLLTTAAVCNLLGVSMEEAITAYRVAKAETTSENDDVNH